MRGDPLVSTIIPTYNRAALVCAAIESVRQQTFRNVEIIIVDDGSTDDTQARLRAYGDSIRVIVQDNAGPAVARNRGIAEARGEILTFLDSDDAWKPTKLERQVRLLERAGKSVTSCLCNTEMLFPDGKVMTTFEYSKLFPSVAEGIWRNVAEVMSTRFVLVLQAIAIRREVLERIGGFDESLRYLEDYEFSLRLALEGPWGFVRDPLVIWPQESPGSWTTSAFAHEVRLWQCAVQMRGSLLKRLEGGDQMSGLRANFTREYEQARRTLRATQLRQSTNPAASALGSALLRLERYRNGMYRRSPWYPRMNIASLSDSSPE